MADNILNSNICVIMNLIARDQVYQKNKRKEW